MEDAERDERDERERERVERAQRLAIERAVRDALVDRTLEDQKAHLAEINGSQRESAESLAALEKLVQRLIITSEAIASREARGLSKRQVWIAALSMTAAWVTMFISVLVSGGSL